jgi:predicted GNAT family acetyltransferase
LRTPPFKLLVSDGPVAALARIAEALQADSPQLPGVIGPRQAAADFARAWTAHAGVEGQISTRLRLHSLRRVATDLPRVSGALDLIAEAERPLALAWFDAFAREATPDTPNDSADAVERFMRNQQLYVWRDPRPVTLAGVVGRTEHGARIGPVYTPPALRGRGYATAAVAELSRRLLAALDYCALYTDLANATSNGIYARIGYTPVADFDEYAFSAPAAAA